MVSFVESGRSAWQIRGSTMAKCARTSLKDQGSETGRGDHPDRLTGDTLLVETAAEHNQGRRVVLLTRYTLSATDRKPRG